MGPAEMLNSLSEKFVNEKQLFDFIGREQQVNLHKLLFYAVKKLTAHAFRTLPGKDKHYSITSAPNIQNTPQNRPQ